MLALGSGCKYRLSLAERFDCTETIINQLLADLYKNPISGTSLVAQWIRLHALNAGGLGSIPGQGTLVREPDATCMLQLRVQMPQLRSLRATTKEPRTATMEPDCLN